MTAQPTHSPSPRYKPTRSKGCKPTTHSLLNRPHCTVCLRTRSRTPPTPRSLLFSLPGRPGAHPLLRPGLQYSYTNNWPQEPLVDNHSNSRHGCLERSFLNRPAWWYRLAAGCIRALEFSWLAPAGARQGFFSSTRPFPLPYNRQLVFHDYLFVGGICSRTPLNLCM
jgi:hypothetical protein